MSQTERSGPRRAKVVPDERGGGAPRLAGLLAMLFLLVGCGAGHLAQVRPPAGAQRALYDDLEAIVVTEARGDWVADRIEFEQIGPRLLQSGCATPPGDRQALRGWLQTEIGRLGGPASALYAKNGNDFDKIEDIVELERVRGSLDWIETHAAADCPFWLVPTADFSGVQSSQGRFVLLLESMGGFQVVHGEGDELRFGGGGGGRLLPGFGIGERLTLVGGVELGGTTTFPADDDGNRSVKPAWAAAVPVMLRVRAGTWRFDTEAALVARAPITDPSDQRLGARLAQAVGIAGLRVSGVMPYVMIWAGCEWLPPVGGEDGLQIIRFGTRVGIDWDP